MHLLLHLGGAPRTRAVNPHWAVAVPPCGQTPEDLVRVQPLGIELQQDVLPDRPATVGARPGIAYRAKQCQGFVRGTIKKIGHLDIVHPRYPASTTVLASRSSFVTADLTERCC